MSFTRTIGAAALGWWVAAGCSLAASYDVEPENSSDVCRDGVDNDADGFIDCMDPDCLGAFCDEDTDRRDGLCSDGVDNDLDGLQDDFDPACWSVAPGHVERCGTIRGTELTLHSARWAGGRFVDDPVGGGADPVLELDASTGGVAAAIVAAPLTGELDNTRIQAAIWLDEGATLELLLSPIQSTSPIRSDIAVGVAHLVPGAPELSVRVGDEAGAIRRPASPADAWTNVTLSLGSGVRLSWEADGSCAAGSETCIELSPDSPLGPAPAFELSISVVGGVALLGQLDVSRFPHDPCITPVPDDGWTSGRIHSFTASRTTYCALFEDDAGRIVTLSSDRTDADAMLAPDTPPQAPRLHEVDGWIEEVNADLTGPVIDWDEASGSFRGAAVVERDGLVTGEVLLVSSGPDTCGGWSVVGEPVAGQTFQFDDRPGGVVGYDVDPATGIHTLFTIRAGMLAETTRDIEQVRWESPSGEPGTFVEAVAAGVNASFQQRHPRHNVTLLGQHELVVRSNNFNRPGTLDAPNDSGPFSVIGPSGILGTFDTLWIEQGLLWMPEPVAGLSWWGLFVYTARSCAGCPAELGFARFQPAFTQLFPAATP